MSYVDIFVAPVPTANRQKFLDHAGQVDPIFKEYGALSVVETWSNDVPEGEVNSLHTAVMRKEDESIIVGWVEWESKEARDAGWEKLMADPRMQSGDMPFDGKRMIFGGFDKIFEI